MEAHLDTVSYRFDSDSAFRHAVTDVLAQLLEQVDDIDADLDSRLSPGNLQVVFEDDGSTFVLSQQTPTHELWLSANLRAYHFRYSSVGWTERDAGEPMLAVLSRLFTEKTGQPCRFSLD